MGTNMLALRCDFCFVNNAYCVCIAEVYGRRSFAKHRSGLKKGIMCGVGPLSGL
jgi:hypothetical protein